MAKDKKWSALEKNAGGAVVFFSWGLSAATYTLCSLRTIGEKKKDTAAPRKKKLRTQALRLQSSICPGLVCIVGPVRSPSSFLTVNSTWPSSTRPAWHISHDRLWSLKPNWPNNTAKLLFFFCEIVNFAPLPLFQIKLIFSNTKSLTPTSHRS